LAGRSGIHPRQPHPPNSRKERGASAPRNPARPSFKESSTRRKPRPITGAHATAHPPHPSHAQRSPQADFPHVILLRPSWLSHRSPQRGRNTLAPVVRLGMTERPRVSARLSGRKNHRVQVTFALYQALAGRSGINPRQPHPPQSTEGAWGFSPTKPRPPVPQRIKSAAKPRPNKGAYAIAHPPHPSHAQRSPQADFSGVILLRPSWLSDRSPQRGRNTLAPVVRLGMTERPSVSARLSGRKNHRVQVTFALYQALAGRSGINPRQSHPPQSTEGAWGFSPTKPRPPVLQRIKVRGEAAPKGHHKPTCRYRSMKSRVPRNNLAHAHLASRGIEDASPRLRLNSSRRRPLCLAAVEPDNGRKGPDLLRQQQGRRI
jgi:hypothetical protein